MLDAFIMTPVVLQYFITCLTPWVKLMFLGKNICHQWHIDIYVVCSTPMDLIQTGIWFNIDKEESVAFIISVKEITFSVALLFWFVCLSVCLLATLIKKLWMDCNDILWRGPQYYKVQGNVVAIWIMIQPWWRFALSECLEYDDYLWTYAGATRWLSEWKRRLYGFFFYLNSLTDKNNIFQQVSDPMV